MADVKRLNYFNHQFLIETDFQDEQAYHMGMRRRHNRFMHGWGVAEGLVVERKSEREILVSPGMAIDGDGREIVLLEARTVELAPPEKTTHVFVVVTYREEKANERNSTGVAGYTRMLEIPAFSTVQHLPADDGMLIPLARVHLDESGRIRHIDLSVRHQAVLRLTPGMITTDLLADEAVTVPKLAHNLRQQHGWVRMSFKPHPMHEKPAFHVGPTEARSEKAGAYGTMGVPAPPGAHRVTGFRIAGEWNDGEIIFDLFRSGWDPDKQQHEREYILRGEKLIGKGPYRKREGVEREINPFERPFDLDCKLDRGHHALAVLVHATSEASISLIAVRFEFDLREYERRQLSPYPK
jgi:hypothetical protein